MQLETPHQAALGEVLRANARLSAAMSSKSERGDVPALRDELERARVILAIERGLAEYVKKGGRQHLGPDQIDAAMSHLRNREGHTA